MRPLRECCTARAEKVFEQLVADRGWSENPHVSQLFYLALEEHAELASFVKRTSLTKIANIQPPASAAMIEKPCSECQGSVRLVIVSAPLLLSIWRLLSLYLSLIERWTFDGSRLRINVRPPTNSDHREHSAIVNEYFAGEPVRPISLRSMLDRHAQGQRGANAPFYDAIRMGQLWVFLHELSHVQSRSAYELSSGDRERLIDRIKSDLVDEDLGPISERKWTEELLADGLALDHLFNSTLSILSESHTPAEAIEGAMLRSLAGVSAAINSIWVLEAIGTTRSASPRLSTSTHPPAALRYHRAVQEISLKSPDTPDDLYMYVARIIGDIGRQFW